MSTERILVDSSLQFFSAFPGLSGLVFSHLTPGNYLESLGTKPSSAWISHRNGAQSLPCENLTNIICLNCLEFFFSSNLELSQNVDHNSRFQHVLASFPNAFAILNGQYCHRGFAQKNDGGQRIEVFKDLGAVAEIMGKMMRIHWNGSAIFSEKPPWSVFCQRPLKRGVLKLPLKFWVTVEPDNPSNMILLVIWNGYNIYIPRSPLYPYYI